jgi:hypothetical protein
MNRYKSLELKLALYETMVLSCLLQCIGVRKLLKKDVDRLEAFHYRKLRTICGWSKVDFKSYNDVYVKTGVYSVSSMISRNRIQWAARVQQLENYRIPKMLFTRRIIVSTDKYQTCNRTSHKSWHTCLVEDLKECQVDMRAVVAAKKGAVKSIIRKGMEIKEKSLVEGRDVKRVSRYSSNSTAKEEKLAAQENMREARKSKGESHTKTTKNKRDKSKK